jgi:hypothetical protein
MSRRRIVGRDTSSAGPSIDRWLGSAVSTQVNHRRTKLTPAEHRGSGPESILWMRDIVRLTGVHRATDAYGQSTQDSVTLTIDAPPAPASKGGGGGSVDLTLLAVLGVMGIIRMRSARIRPLWSAAGNGSRVSGVL